MAIIFELSALCHGAVERDAFVRHIDGFEHELTTLQQRLFPELARR